MAKKRPITSLPPNFCKDDIVRLSQQLAKNNGNVQNVFNTLISYGDVNSPETFYLPGQPVDEGPDESGIATVPRRMHALLIQLTSAVDLGTGLATAKFLIKDGSSYAIDGNEFEIYDIFSKWRHSLPGDRGYLDYDAQQAVLMMRDMNSPIARRITLAANLGSGDTTFVAAEDTDTHQEIEKVFGTYVKVGKSINKNSNEVDAMWYPFADNGDGTFGKWRAKLSRECLV